MVRGHLSRIVAGCAVSTLVFGLVAVASPALADSGHSRHDGNSSDGRGGDSDHGHQHQDQNGTLFVSPQGSSTNSGWSCDDATFTSINAAVTAAPTGGTVVVCEGTYAEDVLVTKALTLTGSDATIDATGLEDGIQVVASNVRVDGFTAENANGEGVLVGVDALTDAGLLPAAGPVLSDVTIENVSAINNNKGFNGTETPNCKYPGDCGGGIHLNVTTHSVVKDSTVTGNSDGVLLTDDYGPSSYNLVEGNVVNDNLSECGIVLPSHNMGAVTFDPTTFQVTAVNPTVGGVYGNVVRDNIADDNGTNKAPAQFGGGGSGSGIGLFGSGPGSAVYDNVIVDNEASGNGLAGLAMHAHLPGGEDIDGNVIAHNDFGTNNVGGDSYDGPPGPSDFQTTGIAIYSAVPAHMVISHNQVHDDSIGIWLSTTITAQGLDHNHYDNVTTPVVVG
jgi:parallel beta-helix repeat protein